MGLLGASQLVLVVKNLSADTGDIRDAGLLPGPRRSPGEGNGYPLKSSCLRIPWTDKPGGLQPRDCTELDTTEVT